MSDERERTYRDEPQLTPEREAAWGRWVDDYVVSCADKWIADGATDRQQIIEAAAVVIADLAQIDDMPWMPLGTALMTRMGAVLFGGGATLEGSERLEFLRALRTIETSTKHERTLALAYHLGLTVQQAAKEHDAVLAGNGGRDKDSEGRTALYRHFDTAGTLLYVGIAKEPGKRGEQHRYHSKWYRFVGDSQIEWFPSRAAAELAERAAIVDELPIFNQTHNRANRAAAVEYLFGALETAAAPAMAKRGKSA